LCLGLKVHQSASDLIVQRGAKVEIFCSHSKTDYRLMLWYQCSPGDTAMKLMGNLYFKKHKMEKPYESGFNISGDLGGDTVKNGSLSFKAAAQELSAVYYCAASLSVGIKIHQFPSDLIIKANDNVQLFCTHEQSDYRVMLWYQQSPGDKALKLLGYGYSEFKNDSVEPAFRQHFKLTGDLSGDKVKNGSLSISKLKAPEHTATYFCAAR
ncbi:hypothetical protein INR49_013146, partial [Caranx melampygus]